MKKNKMMRVASVLLIAILMSTCIISGTFAKYTTSDQAQDSARVAKFGVTVTASGSLFSKTYIQADGNTPGTGDPGEVLTVKSSDTANVVAPGTKNTNGITFAITGTPEVAVKINIAVTNIAGNESPVDIFLKARTAPEELLPDMTTGNTEDRFENTADYYPIKYTLKQTKDGSTTTLVDAGTLAAVKTKLESLSGGFVAPNTNLANEIGTLKLTWEWDFDASGAGTYDKQDTLLGDLAAGIALSPTTSLTANTDYSINTEVKIVISVTQVD